MTPNPQLPTTQNKNLLEVECINPQCPMAGKGRKMRKEMLEPQLMNSPLASVIVYSHEQGVTCQYCNTYYQFGIAGFQIQVQWGIVPAERPNKVVLAPAIPKLN